MKKKIAGQVLIFLLLFLAWRYAGPIRKTVPVAGFITGPLPVFPQVQINLLRSENPDLAEDAAAETSRTLLRHIVPDLANEPWQTRYLFLDLFGDREPELVFAFSLPPDRGLLAIIQKQDSRYALCHCLEDLLPVGRIERLAGPEGNDLLITREDRTEMAGAYSESQTVKIWAWQQNKPETVWEEHAFWELNLLNTWQNPQAQPRQWYKLVQAFTVSAQAAPSCQVLVNGEQRLYSSPASEKESLPPAHSFSLAAARNIQACYQWDKDWHRFVLSTGTLERPGSGRQPVAVLKDMDNHLESLVLPWQKQYCQVLTKEGRVVLAKKEEVKPSLQQTKSQE